MPDFQYTGEGLEVSADFVNQLTNGIAFGVFLKTFGLPVEPRRDAKGNVHEEERDAFLRLFCIVAAYSVNVRGLGDWQPPSWIADRQTIIDSAERFLNTAKPAMMVEWAKAVNRVMYGISPLVPENEQGTGGDADFHQGKGSASTNGSSTAPLVSAVIAPPSRKSRKDPSRKIRSAGKSRAG